jgi:hypothetical protein
MFIFEQRACRLLLLAKHCNLAFGNCSYLIGGLERLVSYDESVEILWLLWFDN